MFYIQAYIAYYETEEEINSQLRVFGKNVKAAYEGMYIADARSGVSGNLGTQISLSCMQIITKKMSTRKYL